jgi:hypothetical protein
MFLIYSSRIALVTAIPSIEFEIGISIIFIQLLSNPTHQRMQRFLVKAVGMRPNDIDCACGGGWSLCWKGMLFNH